MIEIPRLESIMDADLIRKQLEDLMKECDELGIKYDGVPIHAVLTELSKRSFQEGVGGNKN